MADSLYCPWFLGAPCLKPEVWAAWWQAILSAAAIFAAVRLATSQERRNVSRKADVYVSLLDNSEQTVSKIISVGVRSFSEFKSICGISQQKLEQMGKALDLVTLQELPDYRLLPIIHDAARTLQHLAKELEKLSTVVEEPASPIYLSVLQSGQGALVRYFNEAADVANEYKSPTMRQRWNKLRMQFLADSTNESD